MSTREIFVITGQSGSGKSSVLRLLEDQGFYTVDNLPAPMLPELAKLLADDARGIDKGIAAVVDARSAASLNVLPSVVSELRNAGHQVTLLYLEASEEVLTQRYRFTRRRHPLGFMASILEGIRVEKQAIAPLREMADFALDTTHLSTSELRYEVLSLLGRGRENVDVLVSSFGFKYGNPHDADFVFDVRFLANPYYEERLKEKSGLDEEVREFIFQNSPADAVLRQCYELLETVLPLYHSSGKNYMHVAIGCTGGRHRSVFAAGWLGERLRQIEGVSVRVAHRDMERHQKDGQP